MAETPTPALAVPYAAPKHVKTMADVQPIAPKKGCLPVSIVSVMLPNGTRWKRRRGSGRGDSLTLTRAQAVEMGMRSTYGIYGATITTLALSRPREVNEEKCSLCHRTTTV